MQQGRDYKLMNDRKQKKTSPAENTSYSLLQSPTLKCEAVLSQQVEVVVLVVVSLLDNTCT